MKYAAIDESGLPVAFYSTEVHGESIPAGAVQITDAQWQECITNQGSRRFIPAAGGDLILEMYAPTPTAEELQQQYTAAIQHHMDEAARALGYDNLTNAVTYAEEPAVPKFQAEGQAFRAWRSVVWDYGYAQLAAVKAGDRQQPTVKALIAELPELVLPA